jgi:hypothetical protein
MAGLWRAAQLMYWRGAAQKVTGAMMCMWWFVGERECGFAQEAWLYCWYTLAVDALLPSSSSANGARLGRAGRSSSLERSRRWSKPTT